MWKQHMQSVLILAATLVICGCVALLPKEKRVTNTPWKTFDEAKLAFEAVAPRNTTVSQMKKIGFDLYSTPNVRVMNYLDIAAATLPLKEGILSDGFLLCLSAKLNCQAFEIEPQMLNNTRYGNFWLDVLNFRRKSRETGWRFKALFVVVDNVVVEKLWSGNPQIDVDQDRINPLGPFQDLGSRIPVPKLW